MGGSTLLCFTKILMLISAIPIALLVCLEIATTTTTGVYQYHSAGWLRECAKWDNLNRRFIVSFGEGGLGQILIPPNHSPSSILQETPLILNHHDVHLLGNSSIGITIDHPRNRLLMAIGDALGYRYAGLAAYDITTWNRLFLTHLSNPGDEKTYAEDVAVDGEGNAYVTDIKGGRIWKVGVNGELISTVESPLFMPKAKGGSSWYRTFFTLNGIVYHPNGYLLVVHTMTGNLYKVDINNDNSSNEEEIIKVVKVIRGGALTYGDGMHLLSPTKLVVAAYPSTRLIESNDNWESAYVVGKFRGPLHRLPTSATVKDGQVYVSYLLGMGYPRNKHLLAHAVFTSSDSIAFIFLDLVASFFYLLD